MVEEFIKRFSYVRHIVGVVLHLALRFKIGDRSLSLTLSYAIIEMFSRVFAFPLPACCGPSAEGVHVFRDVYVQTVSHYVKARGVSARSPFRQVWHVHFAVVVWFVPALLLVFSSVVWCDVGGCDCTADP